MALNEVGIQEQLDFTKEWTVERLERMTLDEYTNLNRDDSFTYWLEAKTENSGSIWGGSAFKFRIYRRRNTDKIQDFDNIRTDGVYSWYLKHGETAEEAFLSVRDIVVSIAKNAAAGNFEAIDGIDLGDAIKWKIAFHFNTQNLVPIFKREVLYRASKSLGMRSQKKPSISEMQRFLFQRKRPDQSTLSLAHEIWGMYNLNNFYYYIDQFLKAAESDQGEKRKFPSRFKDLTVKVKIEFGGVSRLVFLKGRNSLLQGVYPLYLFYPEENQLVLAYGKSEELGDIRDWPADQLHETIENWHQQEFQTPAPQYGNFHIKAVYDLNDELDADQLQMDLDEMISDYKRIQFEPEEQALAEEQDQYGHDQELESDFLQDVFLEPEEIQNIQHSLEYKRNVVLQGPPGTGKTFLAKRLAYLLLGTKDDSRIETVQFHQSYSYEDFIQGYRPTEDGNFKLVNGIFYRFCERARQQPDKKFVFIIDEINRGNLSKVFGELMLLIEKDKRGQHSAVSLAYARADEDKFYIPNNLYLIGTMNTADRSLAVVDYALRRRFAFINIMPCFNEQFKQYLRSNEVDESMIQQLLTKIESLNEAIRNDNNLGSGFQIGHAYFCQADSNQEDRNWYEFIIRHEIAPLLEEYWFDNEDLAQNHIRQLLN